MAKTLTIRVGSGATCKLSVSRSAELCVQEQDVLTLEYSSTNQSFSRVQIKVGDLHGTRWLPSAAESRLYKSEELSSSPTASEVQICCSEPALKKELRAKETEVSELTNSALEMQQAAAALVRRHEELLRMNSGLKCDVESLRKKLKQAQANTSRLQSALSATTLEHDRLTLQYDSLKAKSAAYESTLQALRSSPAVDQIDELLRDRLRHADAPAFVRICEGQYFCEGQQITVTVKAGSLAVKSEDGFQLLDEWLSSRPRKSSGGRESSARSRSVRSFDDDEKFGRRVWHSHLNSPISEPR